MIPEKSLQYQLTKCECSGEGQCRCSTSLNSEEAFEGGSLGIVANIASASPEQPTYYDKFELQNLAAKLLPEERVAQCLRYRAPVNFEKDSPTWYTVEVHKSEATSTAYYEHLMVCDRVWGCPVCAARISEMRRRALTTAIERTEYQTVLVTFTLSHHMGDSLMMLTDAISGAYRRLKSGRFWQKIKADFGLVGNIKSTEVTYGENGWHPHIHVLMLFEHELGNDELEDLETRLKSQWLSILEAFGMVADWEHGCDVKAGDQWVRDYVAKFGRLPKVERKPKWTLEHEVAKSHVKRGRNGGLTPFELLAEYGNGDARAGKLFVEYYNCFKGRHQLQWSRGLRDLLSMDEIEQELEEELRTDEDQMVAELYPDDWRKVCWNRARGKLLAVASQGEVEDIWEFIWNLPEPPPRKLVKHRRRPGVGVATPQV